MSIDYQYTLSRWMLLFGIALALAFQMLGSGGTIFILSLAAFQLYFLYLMLIVKPQVIRLDDKGLTIPSLFFQGLSFRRVNWSDVKKVYTWGGPHQAPVIRIERYNGARIDINSAWVNREGIRSRGIEPYQQLLRDIENYTRPPNE